MIFEVKYEIYLNADQFKEKQSDIKGSEVFQWLDSAKGFWNYLCSEYLDSFIRMELVGIPEDGTEQLLKSIQGQLAKTRRSHVEWFDRTFRHETEEEIQDRLEDELDEEEAEAAQAELDADTGELETLDQQTLDDLEAQYNAAEEADEARYHYQHEGD